MPLEEREEAELLRIFIGESDRWEGRPLFEALVPAYRDRGRPGGGEATS